MKMSYIALEPDHITDKLNPRTSLLKQIAGLLSRRNGNPGYVVLENVKTLLSTVENANQFQYNLMSRLRRYVHPGCGNKYRIKELGVDGTTSYKDFHQDPNIYSYVSLCYGPRKNLVGGQPCILDLKVVVDLIHKKKNRIIRTVGDSRLGDGISYVELDPASLCEAKVWRIKIDTDLTKFPILVFNNTARGDILHGATDTRRKNPSKPASRLINHVGIVA